MHYSSFFSKKDLKAFAIHPPILFPMHLHKKDSSRNKSLPSYNLKNFEIPLQATESNINLKDIKIQSEL